MHRRTLLAALATGVTGSVAGCGAAADAVCGADSGGGPADGTPGDGAVARDELPVPESELVRSTGRDAIPAITAPAFGPRYDGLELEGYWWGTGESFTYTLELTDDDPVIGVERDGTARAYPLKILVWHEVVNDDLGGPILVSYCPLCRSGVVAERPVGGSPATFGVSGLLWRDNLVMYDDRTDSLWSQLSATAIRGPRTGDRLRLLPSTVASFGDWRAAHPDTTVLQPVPTSGTVTSVRPPPYPRDPYERYYDAETVGDGRAAFDDDRLHPKTVVLGIADGDEAVAYPPGAVADAGAVNDVVGSVPVVVTTTDGGTPVAYDRRVDGQVREFERTADGRLRAAETTWAPATGEGTTGRFVDRQLAPVTEARRLFWFAWLEFHPDSRLYTGREDGLLAGCDVG